MSPHFPFFFPSKLRIVSRLVVLYTFTAHSDQTQWKPDYVVKLSFCFIYDPMSDQSVGKLIVLQPETLEHENMMECKSPCSMDSIV